MIDVLIRENLIDREYIDAHTLGFEQLKARAAEYPPARAAQICGIDEQVIVELARAFGATKKASIRLNYGMQRVRGGGNAVRAIACLPSLTGAWRERSGGVAAVVVGVGAGRFRARSSGPICCPAGRRSCRVVDQHECDRRRAAASGRRHVRPEGRGADRLQLEPGRGRAGFGEGRGGLRARGLVHDRARTLPDRYRRLRRPDLSRDHATRTSRRPQVVRAYARDGEPAGDRAGRRVALEYRDLPRPRPRDGSHRSGPLRNR